MDKMSKKGMTIATLAGMVAKGFENTATKEDVKNVDGHIDVVRQRLSSLEKKVDKIDYQVDEAYDILKRFEENDILNLQKRVQTLEKAVRALANQGSIK